ncbi:MAG: efflux RND transporter permease subunit [Rickettsiaceae bacterium]|nr:MAG: efflux RND transporter permease subunit [Rickettsiaceae bacterium]
MSLSEICIKKPILTIVASIIIVVVGLVLFQKLPIKELPDIDFPEVTVNSSYVGADAFYVENNITLPIEKALKNIKNLESVSSNSSDSNSHITMAFSSTSDINIALNDIRSKISEISYLLPKDMPTPQVIKTNYNNFQTFWLTISSNEYDELTLTKIARQIQSTLERLPSVGNAQIYGNDSYDMRIEPIAIKMYQHKISPTEIEDAVKKQNRDYPAGLIKTDSRIFTLRLKGGLTTPEEFGDIILNNKQGSILKLRDVAKVYLAPSENDGLFRYNGQKTIAIGFAKQSKSNLIQLSKEIREKLDEIKKSIPSSVIINVAFDDSISVNASIKSVFFAIFEAILLVTLIIYLFLGSLRITIIPLLTIPISLIGTFSIMYAMNFSINIFTLLAMVLAIGLVVDDAIVVLENIYRHHKSSNDPIKAANIGSVEIKSTIVAMTLTLSAVFLPVGFMEGFIGKLFIEFAWTLAFCVLISGFVALSLTPMMVSRMILTKKSHNSPFFVKFNLYFELILSRYLYYLNLVVNLRKALIFIAIGIISALTLSILYVDKTLAPMEDSGFLQVFLTGVKGSTVKQSEKSLIELERTLANNSDVSGYLTMSSGNNGFAFVPLKDWSLRQKSQAKICIDINEELSKIPGMSVFATNPPSIMSGGSSHAVEFILQTSLDYEYLDKISQQFVSQLNINPIFVNTKRNLDFSKPILDIQINRDRVYLYGLNLENIGNTLKYIISGKQISDFRMGDDIYDVNLMYNIQERKDLSNIQNILIKSDQGMIPLINVAKVEEKVAADAYMHYDLYKSVNITSDLAPNYKIADAINAITKISSEIIKNDEAKLKYTGEIERMNESNNNIIIVFSLAMIFIYLVLSAQFESFTDPLFILLAVPFSILGGILALLLTNNSINIYSNIGLVTLIGLITKNSIMLIEFANQLHNKGINAKEAILTSASLRFRPILMTTIATVCGAVPLLFASGAGAGARNSIGIVIVGGMTIGTLFTLFIVPIIYANFKKVSNDNIRN